MTALSDVAIGGLRAAIAAVLAEAPGLTARQIAQRVCAAGGTYVDKRDVNRVLYRNLDVFTYEGDPATSAPEWSVALGSSLPDDRQAGRATRHGLTELSGLYAWQREALAAWRQNGQRGVIEAVTGAGKTRVGLAAMYDSLTRGGKVLVLVPTKELQRQWFVNIRKVWPDVVIDSRGDGHYADFESCDVLVSIVNSAREALHIVPPNSLLIGDECHRYGSEANQNALDPQFSARLGLSATFERNDTGCHDYLTPYFGPLCFRLGYERALRDNVVAHFSVALIGVRFSAEEQARYEERSAQCGSLRKKLVDRFDVKPEPFGEFMAKVQELSKGPICGATIAARQYLQAFAERRQLLAETPAKQNVLALLSPAARSAERTIIFNQTIAAAERATSMFRVQGFGSRCLHSELDRYSRAQALADFESGRATVIVAAQVLDEGVDVPAADLAIVVASSKTRRQMIQRMGRVLRLKNDGRLARFAILYVEGTSEDPNDGAYERFLDDVTRLADAVATFPSSAPTADAVTFLSKRTSAEARAVARTLSAPHPAARPAAPRLEIPNSEARPSPSSSFRDLTPARNSQPISTAVPPKIIRPVVWVDGYCHACRGEVALVPEGGPRAGWWRVCVRSKGQIVDAPHRCERHPNGMQPKHVESLHRSTREAINDAVIAAGRRTSTSSETRQQQPSSSHLQPPSARLAASAAAGETSRSAVQQSKLDSPRSAHRSRRPACAKRASDRSVSGFTQAEIADAVAALPAALAERDRAAKAVTAVAAVTAAARRDVDTYHAEVIGSVERRLVAARDSFHLSRASAEQHGLMRSMAGRLDQLRTKMEEAQTAFDALHPEFARREGALHAALASAERANSKLAASERRLGRLRWIAAQPERSAQAEQHRNEWRTRLLAERASRRARLAKARAAEEQRTRREQARPLRVVEKVIPVFSEWGQTCSRCGAQIGSTGIDTCARCYAEDSR